MDTMASKRVIFLLFLLKISSFCDCSTMDPNFGSDGGNTFTPGFFSGGEISDAAMDIASESDAQLDPEMDVQLASEIAGTASAIDLKKEDIEGSPSWRPVFSSSWSSESSDGYDSSLICPVDSDKCVTFTVSVKECQMNSSTIVDNMYCSCTSSCLFFDDCCYGYSLSVKKPYVMILEKQYWSCTRFTIGVAQNTACIYSYFVVGRCPSVARTDPELVRRCEHPKANDTVFVDSRKIFYRNRYCALCHGVNSSELTPYIIFAPCQDNLRNEDTFCGQKPFKLEGNFPPVPRTCVDDSSIVSQCDSRVADQISQLLCSSESEQRLMVNGTIYRNDDCARCNGILDDNIEPLCEASRSGSASVFSTAYFYPELRCTSGLRLSGTECVPEVSSWPDCKNNSVIFAVIANGYLQCYDGFNRLKKMKSLMNIESPVMSSYEFDFDVSDGYFTTFLEFPADILPHTSELEDFIEYSLEETREQSCPDNKIIIRERCNIDYELFMANSGDLFRIVDDPHLFKPVDINGTVYIMYNDTIFVTPFMWENDTYFSRFSNKWNFTKQPSFSLYGKVVDIDTCASIIVGDSLITEKERDNVTYLIYQDISFPPESYVRYTNGSVRLCWTGPDPPEPVSMFQYSQGQNLLNLIAITLSTVCLLATLLTYCIFKPLRNLQGISIMSFVSALLVAQVMLQFIAPNMVSLPTVCTIAAIITHYLLLVVFTWTNILAWDLVRCFASSSFLPKRHSQKRRLIGYLTTGWCLPLIIVVPCLITQVQNSSLFRYGKIGTSCWIYQARAIVLAFLVPVAVSFLVNIVLFSFTAYGVHKSKRDSSVLHTGVQERRKELFMELVVQFKISCLLGFGWSFGFIAAFAQTTAIWTIFIITSSLQGVFVFVFFGANQRVRGLWRKKIYGSKARGRNTTSTGTLTTVTSSSMMGMKDRSKK